MTMLTKGANAVLLAAGTSPTSSVVVKLGWTVGTPGLVDASALICDTSGKVAADEDFVFFNNPHSPDETVWVVPEGAAAATDSQQQVLINLDELPDSAAKVVVALAILEDGHTFGEISKISARVCSLQTGAELVAFEVESGFATETAVIIGELYRYNGAWKFRAVAQGYAEGLAGIARDYGVDVA